MICLLKSDGPRKGHTAAVGIARGTAVAVLLWCPMWLMVATDLESLRAQDVPTGQSPWEGTPLVTRIEPVDATTAADAKPVAARSGTASPEVQAPALQTSLQEFPVPAPNALRAIQPSAQTNAPRPAVFDGSIQVQIEADGSAFEVRLWPGGISLVPVGEHGYRPQRGVCLLQASGDPKSYRYDLLRVDDSSRLVAYTDLSRLAGKAVQLQFHVLGRAGLRDVSHRLQWAGYLPPDRQMLAAAAVIRQRTCPVSGKPLGCMGEPIPVKVAGTTIYVCSAECRDALQTSRREHEHVDVTSFVVSVASEKDQPLIERQRVCPVMDEPLGSMGPPIKVLVGDRPVFLCCRGCIKKLKAEPLKYLTQLTATKEGRSEKVH